jgi:hypothetical protein
MHLKPKPSTSLKPHGSLTIRFEGRSCFLQYEQYWVKSITIALPLVKRLIYCRGIARFLLLLKCQRNIARAKIRKPGHPEKVK